MDDRIDEISRRLAAALREFEVSALANAAPHHEEDELCQEAIAQILREEFGRVTHLYGSVDVVAHRLLGVIHELDVGGIRGGPSAEAEKVPRLLLLAEFLRDQISPSGAHP